MAGGVQPEWMHRPCSDLHGTHDRIRRLIDHGELMALEQADKHTVEGAIDPDTLGLAGER
jgi:hypothetical protein